MVGIDNMNDAYDPRMKEYRLRKLQAMPGFTFHKLDISNKSIIDQFKEDKFDGVINLAARAGVRYSVEDPWVLCGKQYDRNLEYAGDLPPNWDEEIHRRFHLQHLWRRSSIPDAGIRFQQ